MYTYRADSLCCTAEIDVAVKSNCTQMKEKKKRTPSVGEGGQALTSPPVSHWMWPRWLSSAKSSLQEYDS